MSYRVRPLHARMAAKARTFRWPRAVRRDATSEFRMGLYYINTGIILLVCEVHCTHPLSESAPLGSCP